jgi:hypothetical protein
MKPERLLQRWTAVTVLTAFLCASCVQIFDDFQSIRKKQTVKDEITLAAFLPGHPQAAGSTVKLLKTFNDFCFFETSFGQVVSEIILSLKSGFSPVTGPKIIRLLAASISINAP